MDVALRLWNNKISQNLVWGTIRKSQHMAWLMLIMLRRLFVCLTAFPTPGISQTWLMPLFGQTGVRNVLMMRKLCKEIKLIAVLIDWTIPAWGRGWWTILEKESGIAMFCDFHIFLPKDPLGSNFLWASQGALLVVDFNFGSAGSNFFLQFVPLFPKHTIAGRKASQDQCIMIQFALDSRRNKTRKSFW